MNGLDTPRALPGIVGDMADESSAFEDAVRCRATGVGLVPIEVIRRLTSAEWGRVRLMGQTAARKMVAILDAEPLIIAEGTRRGD